MLRPLFAAVICCALGLPAAAEETASVEQSSNTTIEIPNPAMARQAPQPMQSLVVVVDGEARSWAPLEKDTDVAWEAYRNGNFPKAVPVFARLAEIGHPVAQWLMGNIYFFGQGIPKDYAKAQAMFEAAASQGYFAAFAPTAQMYVQGLGVPADPSKAYYWYNIAAAQLPDSAERTDMMDRREGVAAQMTPAQIEAAQKRANNFKAKQVVPPDPEDVEWMQE
ncbi:tetratricopeptide repeat protein [Dongia deserti]|uniref:tetratricopeptide repeat protein n=1 Tax=Dongia deserti TaxID=2268030 RepID=UPI000E64965D|nr:tetratricopeptide repeat protein [Dongia deserti]